jgi:hypothetical protein
MSGRLQRVPTTFLQPASTTPVEAGCSGDRTLIDDVVYFVVARTAEAIDEGLAAHDALGGPWTAGTWRVAARA